MVPGRSSGEQAKVARAGCPGGLSGRAGCPGGSWRDVRLGLRGLGKEGLWGLGNGLWGLGKGLWGLGKGLWGLLRTWLVGRDTSGGYLFVSGG